MSNKLQKDRAKDILLGVGIACITMLAIILVVFAIKGKDEPKIVGAAGASLSAKDRTDTMNRLNSEMDILISKPILLSVDDTSETTLTMLYSGKGEAIAESAYNGTKSFFLKTHNAISFSEDSLGYGEDSDVLSILNNGVKLALNNKNYEVLSKIEYSDVNSEDGDTSAEQTKVETIFIDFTGWEQIKDLYSYVSDEFGTDMADHIKSAASETIGEDKQLTLRLAYRLLNDSLQSGACYLCFGDTPSNEIAWSDMNLNWTFNFYLELYDWSFNEKWYEYDWDTLNDWEDETIDEINNLYIEEYNGIIEMINQFQTDNNIPLLTDDMINNEEIDEDGLDILENAENQNSNTESSGD